MTEENKATSGETPIVRKGMPSIDSIIFTDDTDFGELGDVPLTAGIGGPVIGTAKLSKSDLGVFVSCTVSPSAESMNAITKAWRDSGVSKDD